MKRWQRIALNVYLTGAVIWGLVLVMSAYNNGAFQRPHTLTGFAFIAVEYIAMALLWPLFPFPS
jgi:hypothetical protein